MGKLAYKKLTLLKKSLLGEELINPESTELLKALFEISLVLFDLKACIKSAWLDGVSFYIFLKKGGMNILCDIFEWLSSKCLP